MVNLATLEAQRLEKRIVELEQQVTELKGLFMALAALLSKG